MPNKYPLVMRLFHWIMAILIITLICVGMWMANLPKDTPDRIYYYGMHKSFGLIALILIVLRIINKVKMHSKIPELPYQISKFNENLSNFTHFTLYLLMILQPLTGFLMSDLSGKGVIFFSYQLPHIFHTNTELATIFWQAHGYLSYGLIAAILLHLAGSLKHYFKDRINLFSRMW